MQYRYLVASQDYMRSGDSFTYRYDRILGNIPKKTKYVDDIVLSRADWTKWDSSKPKQISFYAKRDPVS